MELGYVAINYRMSTRSQIPDWRSRSVRLRALASNSPLLIRSLSAIGETNSGLTQSGECHTERNGV
ncbi:hypothetical protein SAMD00079811_62010 [Scytonema sp. HK-05]|nr:hypothetical protein SAMD00079811_62010 [Scytonema sp. HK-05]